MILVCTFFRTIWQSISICFVPSWKIGLADICNATGLSQYNNTGSDSGTFKSWRMYLSQVNSKQEFVIAWYSTSDDMDTLDCFPDLQEIIEFPKNMPNPEIDCLIVRQPSQSELQYACNLKSLMCLWTRKAVSSWFMHKLNKHMNWIHYVRPGNS